MNDVLGIKNNVVWNHIWDPRIIGFLQESLHGNVNGWTVKYLTKVGKEVMINQWQWQCQIMLCHVSDFQR